MIPQKNSPIVQIPLTFDYRSKPAGLSNDKFLLSALVIGVWFFASIAFMFTGTTIMNKILFIICSFIIVMFVTRICIMREYYFKKKREELVEKDYQYPYSMFWNIYEVTNSYPTICRYANGLKSMFVVFDKDVIVGKEKDNEYYHYEAISEAYLQMYKRGIECMHIDYMDTVGKDARVKSLFDMADNSQNPDIKEILTRMFNNVEDIMQHSYASYDVYCFFYNGKDELFMDELDVVINAFLEANYIRYRILNKEEIGELVKSVFNLNKFSVNYASEKLFSDIGGVSYLTPIWVERGNERKILHKTREEIEAERKVREVEKSLRSSRKKPRGVDKATRRMQEEEDIDLFGDDGGYGYNDQGYQEYDNGYQNYNDGYGAYDSGYQDNDGGYQDYDDEGGSFSYGGESYSYNNDYSQPVEEQPVFEQPQIVKKKNKKNKKKQSQVNQENIQVSSDNYFDSDAGEEFILLNDDEKSNNGINNKVNYDEDEDIELF